LPKDFVNPWVRMIASSMAAETIGAPGHRHLRRWKAKRRDRRNPDYQTGISMPADPFLGAWKGLKT
jgi:hypothetical protein